MGSWLESTHSKLLRDLERGLLPSPAPGPLRLPGKVPRAAAGARLVAAVCLVQLFPSGSQLWSGLPVSGATSDCEESGHKPLSSWAGRGWRDLGQRAGCGLADWTEVSREGSRSERAQGVETILSPGSSAYWLWEPGWVVAERGPSRGHTAEKGQKRGWNPVPCCPGQYSCL